MKSLFVVIFLSSFSMLQLVDSTGSVSFATFALEHDANKKYKFLLRITDDIDKIKKEIEEIPRKSILGEHIREYILIHVPKDLKINGKDARTVLRKKIEAINEMQTKTIKNLDETICNRISYKSEGIIDPDIQESYKNWVKNPYDWDHIAEVRAEYPTMKSKFENWQKIFIEEMKEIVELRDEINANVNGSISICKTLLKEPENAPETAEMYCNGIFDSIFDRQKKLVRRLEIVADILLNYNEERMKWIEFLIQMRKNIDSKPRVVKLVPTLQKSKSKKYYDPKS